MTKYNEQLLNGSSDGNIKIVKSALDNGADINVKNNNGRTALMIASRYGYIEIVKLLLDNKADVNVKNEYGNTALMLASGHGYTEIVKLLLDNGADINVKNDDGYTALVLASGNGHTDIVKLLKTAMEIKESVLTKKRFTSICNPSVEPLMVKKLVLTLTNDEIKLLRNVFKNTVGTVSLELKIVNAILDAE